MEIVTLFGRSGRSYDYQVMNPGAQWSAMPGNYAFVGLGVLGPTVHYIGQCKHFSKRPLPPGHDRWEEAVKKYGATHVLVHVTVGGEDVRIAEERDLIAQYNPPMNEHYRTGLINTSADSASGALSGLAPPKRRGLLGGGLS